MKKAVSIIALLSMFIISACGTGTAGGASSSAAAASTAAASSAEPSSTMMVGVPNPWIDCGTLEEASKITGFTMEAPDKVNGNVRTLVQAVKNDMMQVFYTDKAVGAEDVKKTIIRKGKGKDDISGDYNEYDKTEKIKAGDLEVQIKSNKGKIHNAIWISGGYTFAIMSDEGLSQAELTAIVALVK